MASPLNCCLIVLCTILYSMVSLSDQVPVDDYGRQKKFLDAFGDWLARAEKEKAVDISDLYKKNSYKRNYPYYDYNNMVTDDDWRGLALQNGQELKNPEGFNGEWLVESSWPEADLNLGQVAGVATDEQGNAVIFHRADRTWEQDTFFSNDTYTGSYDGPITDATIITLNKSNGAVLDSWGQNRFYLPHGLTIDKDGNYWVTDLVLHQVFKFSKDKGEPILTLGVPYEPAQGNDDVERFCKPTDVAVASNGDFFVADGYCNSRIVKYNKEGHVLGVFGQDNFWVPHSITLAEDLDLVIVADRENKRILCYKAGLEDADMLGYPDRAYLDPDVIGKMYAVTYSPQDGFMYGVTAPTGDLPGSGFTFDLNAVDNGADIVAVWSPQEEGFDLPHDLDVDRLGDTLYVGEIGPNKIWKFTKINK